MAATHSGRAYAALVLSAGLALPDVSPPEDRFVTVGPASAVLREIRHAEVAAGTSSARVLELPPLLEPGTVALHVLSGPGELRILEQAAVFPVLDRESLLRSLVGSTVRLRRYHAEEMELVEGRLAMNPFVDGPQGRRVLPLYVETPQGEVRVLEGTEIELDALPDGPWQRMRLDWVLQAAAAGRYRLELSYVTRGLWAEPGYTVRIDSEGRAAVAAFATVHNETGIALRQVTLQLALPPVGAPAPGGAAAVHRVAWPVTLAAGEARRFALGDWTGLAAVARLTAILPIARETARVAARQRLDLRAAGGASWPFQAPAQVVRLNQQNLPFLATAGEPVPGPEGTLSLLGDPVDAIRVERRGVDVEDRWRGVLRVLNQGAAAVEVEVLEPLAPGEKLLASSAPATETASHVRFSITVAAAAVAEATYELGSAEEGDR